MIIKKIGTANTAILGFLLLLASQVGAMISDLGDWNPNPNQRTLAPVGLPSDDATSEDIKKFWHSLKEKKQTIKNYAFFYVATTRRIGWAQLREHIFAAAEVNTEINTNLGTGYSSLLQLTVNERKPDVEIINFLFTHGIKPDEKFFYTTCPVIHCVRTKKIAELFFKHGLKIDSQEQFFEMMENSLYPTHSSKLIPFFIAQGATAAAFKNEKEQTNLFTILARRAYSYTNEQQKKLLRKAENLFAGVTQEQAYELLTMKYYDKTPEEHLVHIEKSEKYLRAPQAALLNVLKNKRLELERTLNKSKSTEILEDAAWILEAFLP